MNLDRLLNFDKGLCRVVPFSPAHLRLMRPDEYQRVLLEDSPEIFKDIGVQAALGPSATLLHDGAVVASFGFVPVTQGVAEGWLWRDKGRSKAQSRMSAKLAREVVDKIAPAMRLHRLQAHVFVQNFPAIRFLEWLQFAREGRMRQLGPRRTDIFIYARLF